MNEGLKAELQDPHGMGGTTLGSTPPALLPPCPPSHPCHHRGAHPTLGGRGGNLVPPPNIPHCPVPPEQPLLPLALGPLG